MERKRFNLSADIIGSMFRDAFLYANRAAAADFGLSQEEIDKLMAASGGGYEDLDDDDKAFAIYGGTFFVKALQKMMAKVLRENGEQVDEDEDEDRPTRSNPPISLN